jgi:hypothetical protein
MDRTVGGTNTRSKISAIIITLKARHALLFGFILSAVGVQAPVPPSPENLSVISVTETTVTLSWASIDGAEAYRIISWNENQSTVLADIYPAYGQKPPSTATISNLVCLDLLTNFLRLHNDDRSALPPADHREICVAVRCFWQQ